MNKKQIFICQLAFGGYPVSTEDQVWAMGTKIYKDLEKQFNEGKFKELYDYEYNTNSREIFK
jgi:hypothetical protein